MLGSELKKCRDHVTPRLIHVKYAEVVRRRPRACRHDLVDMLDRRAAPCPGDFLRDTESRPGARLPLLQASPSGFACPVNVLRHVERIERKPMHGGRVVSRDPPIERTGVGTF